jgi:small subunit ribosomal protein S20
MANIKSQIKRNRTNEAARERNKAVRSEVKTRVKHAERAATEGAEDAAELTKQAIRSIDRAARKGVFHRNAAARRKSRLMRQLADTPAES